MTRNQARKKTRKLIRRSTERMRKNIERVFMSGAVNLPSYEDDYVLPKTIMLALLEEEIHNFTPHEGYKDAKKIKKCAKNIYASI